MAKEVAETLAEALANIRNILADKPVKLIAVSKQATCKQIEDAFSLGVTEFGENRVQDALKKRADLSPALVRSAHWHFIGHLQTNKVKQVVGNFDLIHSVDSLRLAKEISQQAEIKGLVQKILLQVKVLPDPSKSGFTPESLKESLDEILSLNAISVEGLMTICPASPDPAIWRQCFKGLSELKIELENSHQIKLKELSMGMTDDWNEAIAYGATMIRIGRALFDRSA